MTKRSRQIPGERLVRCPGDFFRIGAAHGAPAEWSEFLHREPVFRVDPRLGYGRLIVTKQPYQVADIAAEPTYGDKMRIATIELAHARSLIGVPLLRDDEVVGFIVTYRPAFRSAMTSSSSNMPGLLKSIQGPATLRNFGSYCRVWQPFPLDNGGKT